MVFMPVWLISLFSLLITLNLFLYLFLFDLYKFCLFVDFFQVDTAVISQVVVPVFVSLFM